MKGKLITFEGCEGSGKSTQLKLLSDALAKEKRDFIFTREPGGNPISEKIRGIILSSENTEITDECEALLYAASRAQVLSDVIAPAIEEGKIVVCDRYIDSSFAYQGYARGLGMEFIEKINAYAVEKFMPDVTIFLDIDPVSAFMRKRGADKDDRIEQEGIEFHKKVYEGYRLLEKKYPERFIPVNSFDTAENIHQKIMQVLQEKGVL